MKKHAMILLETVIDVVMKDTPPEYPPDLEGNLVTAVECDSSVKIGMIYRGGTFSEYVPAEPPVPEPTDIEVLMQEMSNAELRDFEIQQGQEMLAQQMADIELAVIGGGKAV